LNETAFDMSQGSVYNYHLRNLVRM